MLIPRLTGLFAAGLVLAGCAWQAAGQPTPVTPDPLEIEPPEHSYLTLSNAEDWSVVVQLQLLSCNNGQRPRNEPGIVTGAPLRTDIWELESGKIWFPFAGDTAGSVQLSPIFGAELFTGGVRLDIEQALVSFGGGAVPYAEVSFGAFRGSQLRTRMEFLRRSWRVAFDEPKAAAVPWWEGALPPVAAGGFQSQLAVPYAPSAGPGENPAKDAIAAWTGGVDPKSRLGPALLAKFLTSRIIETIEPQRLGIADRNPLYTGFDPIFPISETAGWDAIARGVGSEVEVVAALVCVLREAGIPARFVLGVIAGDDDERRGLEIGSGRDLAAAWVEFYLYDEPATKRRRDAEGDDAPPVGGWIPIDPLRQREHRGNKAPPLNTAWQFFGNNEAYDLYVPLAYHLHPITTATWYGFPALYGWQAEPGVPACGSHEILIEVDRPTRGGDNRPRIQVGQ